jgi:O-antigen ligase
MPRPDTRNPGENALFICFLAVLVWLPLPLGSNRPASESIMHITVALMMAGRLILYFRKHVSPTAAITAALPVLVPLALVMAWQWLQGVNLPPGWATSIHHALGGVDPRPADAASISLSPRDSARAAMNTLAYLQIFALTLLLVNRRERIRTLIFVLVVSGTFQAAYGAFMVLSGTEYLLFMPKEHYLGVATGTFVNRNHLAGYLELCLALGIGLLLADLRGSGGAGFRDSLRRFLNTLLSRKAQLRLLLAVMVIGLVLTRSRMGNSAFFISLTLMALIYFAGTRQITRGGVILFSSLLLVDVLIVGNFFGFEQVVDRLQATTVLAEQRPQVARDTLLMIGDYPITGIGAGAYHAVYPGQQSLSTTGYFDHAHNDYLEFMAELGVPFSLLAGLAVLASLSTAFRAITRRRDPLMRALGAGSLMGLMSLMIHATVDFNFYIPANAATFMVVMALPWVALHLERRSG